MKAALLVLVGILVLHGVVSQLSKPIANDEQLQKLQNSSPYANKKAVQKQDISFGQDATKFLTQSKCKHVDLDIRWQSTVGSSVYQTPVAFDLFSDGKQELIVPTFVRYLEVLQGTNGAEAQAAFTAHHIRTSAQNQLSHDHVLQQWPFSHPNFASHSSPLLYDIDKDGQMEIVQALVTGEVLFFKQSGKLLPQYTIKIQPLKVRKDWYRGLDETNVEFSMSLQNENKPSQNAEENLVPNKNAQKRKLFSVQSDAKEVMEKRPRKNGVKTDGMEGYFSKEAIDAMELISYVPQSMRPFVDPKDELNIFYSKRYDEELQQRQREASKDQVFVDAHILATPVIADIDDDGHDELILSVSYYFDREYYSKPENIAKLDIDVEIGKFIAGGLVVIDLANLNKKWDVHLDLTTDKTKLKAYIYSSPTVADIDSDGSLDVIIGTALGFIYAFDKYGSRKDGFPFVMGQIQGQITAEDVNGDGDIELCAVDFKSNLICLNGKGKVIWERQLSGFCSQSIAVGDINGDGVLELVVGTSTGHIWAVRGDNGKVLQNFPIKTNGPIYATALLTQVNTTVSTSGITSLIQRSFSKGSDTPNSLTIVIPSFDGYLYLIDGYDGCTDKIDLGEKSYSQVLATDLTGSGKLDLIVSTMNGNVYCFGTAQNYHPLRASNMQIQSTNGFAYRYNYHGIYVKHESRVHRDVIGSNFKVQFEIVDKRKMPFHIPRSYKVKISIGNYKELFTKTYTEPGVYVEVLPTPSERMYGTVVVQMHNEKGQAYVDSFSVSFNMGFLATVKWAIVMPFVLVCVILLFASKGSQERLPS